WNKSFDLSNSDELSRAKYYYGASVIEKMQHRIKEHDESPIAKCFGKLNIIDNYRPDTEIKMKKVKKEMNPLAHCVLFGGEVIYDIGYTGPKLEKGLFFMERPSSPEIEEPKGKDEVLEIEIKDEKSKKTIDNDWVIVDEAEENKDRTTTD